MRTRSATRRARATTRDTGAGSRDRKPPWGCTPITSWGRSACEAVHRHYAERDGPRVGAGRHVRRERKTIMKGDTRRRARHSFLQHRCARCTEFRRAVEATDAHRLDEIAGGPEV